MTATETASAWPAPRRKLEKVVIAYGGRGGSDDALAVGTWIAASTGDQPVVTTVYPKEPVTVLPGIGADWVKTLQADARAVQARAQEYVRAHEEVPVKPQYRVVGASSAAAGLDQVAERTQALLLVVGSSGKGVHRRVSNNHTANRLLQGSPVPVLLAPRGFAERRPDAPLERVGCAFVPTREGRNALRQAAGLAQRARARLEVFTVLGPTAEQPRDDDRARRDFFERTRTAMGEAARAEVDGLSADLQVGIHLLDGDVVNSLAALDSEDCQILVCGSRGYGPVRRVLLGGVVERLARRAATPLVVVPRSAR